jgi:hypothetical protein
MSMQADSSAFCQLSDKKPQARGCKNCSRRIAANRQAASYVPRGRLPMGCAPFSHSVSRRTDRCATPRPAVSNLAFLGNSAPVWASTVPADMVYGRTSSRGAHSESPSPDYSRRLRENPGLPDEQPFSPAAGEYVVVGGPGTHPPGWVRCHRAPATTDPFRTVDHKGFYLARIVRELRSRKMRARISVITLVQPLRRCGFASAPLEHRQRIVSYGDTPG